MIEIVSSENKAKKNELRVFAQSIGFELAAFNAKASHVKMSAGKVNSIAEKILLWVVGDSSLSDYQSRVECLNMTMQILKVNSEIDNAKDSSQPGSESKISLNSLFSHAEKLLSFRKDGE